MSVNFAFMASARPPPHPAPADLRPQQQRRPMLPPLPAGGGGGPVLLSVAPPSAAMPPPPTTGGAWGGGASTAPAPSDLMASPSLLGRVPNFPLDYLAALHGAAAAAAVGHATGGGARGAAPRSSPPDPSSLATTAAGGGWGVVTSPIHGADAFLSGATIVTNGASAASTAGATTTSAALPTVPAPTPPSVVITKAKPPKISPSSKSTKGKRRPAPSQHPPHKHCPPKPQRHPPKPIVLSPSATSAAPPSHPVPEFLCHLYSMLCDPRLSDMISWAVPRVDETSEAGGGRAGVGKVVVHDPTRLQDEVLGNYYRHSKYASFQRQLNYFGFKKRLHSAKKGKMCPCSFVHDQLGPDPQSLLNLKRRPPSNKRATSEGGLPEKRRGRPRKIVDGGVVPSGLSASPSSGSMNTATIGATSLSAAFHVKNAPWAPLQNNGAARPMNAPILAQAAAALPGNPPPSFSWPPLHGSELPHSTIPMLQQHSATTGGAPVIPRAGNDAYALRARNYSAVLEARKSLQINFLKTQQELASRPDPPLLSNAFQAPSGETWTQQPPLAPGQLPNPPVVSMTDAEVENLFGRLSALPPALTGTTTQKSLAEPVETGSTPFPLANSARFLSQPPAALLGDNFLAQSVPPPNNPPFALSHTNHYQPAVNVGPPTFFSKVAGNPHVVPTAAVAHAASQVPGNGVPPNAPQTQVQFNELLSNLLSTNLPPSDELFDDEMSAGNFSDFGEGALQVADDGMLLP